MTAKRWQLLGGWGGGFIGANIADWIQPNPLSLGGLLITLAAAMLGAALAMEAISMWQKAGHE